MSATETFSLHHTMQPGTVLVEASAGTGKTYSIAGLYVRMIYEQGLSAESILVVTFTNAATAELKTRIRQRLQDAIAVTRARQEDPEAYAETDIPPPGRDPQLLRRDLQRLRRALESFDRAAIHTPSMVSVSDCSRPSHLRARPRGPSSMVFAPRAWSVILPRTSTQPRPMASPPSCSKYWRATAATALMPSLKSQMPSPTTKMPTSIRVTQALSIRSMPSLPSFGMRGLTAGQRYRTPSRTSSRLSTVKNLLHVSISANTKRRESRAGGQARRLGRRGISTLCLDGSQGKREFLTGVTWIGNFRAAEFRSNINSTKKAPPDSQEQVEAFLETSPFFEQLETFFELADSLRNHWVIEFALEFKDHYQESLSKSTTHSFDDLLRAISRPLERPNNPLQKVVQSTFQCRAHRRVPRYRRDAVAHFSRSSFRHHRISSI